MACLAPKTVLRYLTLSLAVSTLFYSCTGKKSDAASLPYYNTPDFTPHFITAAAAEKEISHTITDFSFTDQNKQPVTNHAIEGKIHVANFFFTACGSICPRMMANLKTAFEPFKNDTNIVFLSYSVTPWLDAAARLKRYAGQLGISSGNWHLLTGDKAAIYSLARTSYFAEENFGYNKDSSEFLHTEHILLIDKTKRIRGIYNGTLQLETEQLQKDIAALKQE